jgi:NAD(P)-dependent dehydrogenase (short-subunit alcohol dehydrogenase family)
MTLIALVTGASKGLGKEVARLLGRHGMTVLLGSRDTARGEPAAAELSTEGLSVSAIGLDVTDGRSVAAAADRVRREHGRARSGVVGMPVAVPQIPGRLFGFGKPGRGQAGMVTVLCSTYPVRPTAPYSRPVPLVL